jgi:phosphatidylglycerol:prolipoprotein diacylglycerol transferase
MFLAILPSVPLIHAFGRIGCFCAGCCYGIPYEGTCHVVFEKSQVAPLGISLFPVQLVESGINILLFILLEIIVRKTKDIRISLATYMLGYGIMRFCLEFLRGDTIRGFLWNLSTSQWISLLLIAGAMILLFCKRKVKQ